jgi:hypothetical protein
LNLRIPKNFPLLPLPPSVPERSPIKKVRACPHANRPAICVPETCGDIVARYRTARTFIASDIDAV